MKTFTKSVDLRSPSAMRLYLTGHERYSTMNSWNRSTSYANCVKIHRLDLTSAQLENAWQLLDVHEVYATINALIQEWGDVHGWQWSVGFNGRSNGYLVLYRGGLDYKNAHTAQCNQCGKLTWHKENVPCTNPGCDGTITMLDRPRPQVLTYPGRGTDEEEDFLDWDVSRLRDRVRLVQEFDRLCDQTVEMFAYYCDHYKIEEQEILVPRMIKVLKAV